MDIFLAVLEAYDPATPGTTTLYYGSKGFNTGPSDVPANQHFDGRILQPATMRRDMFSSGTTMGRSRTSIGDLVLANPDGALDCLLDYGFDGRRVWIYYGAESATFPSGFNTLFVGTMDQLEVGRETVTVKMRDRQTECDVPLQTTLYAGDNALPAGLEGVATDLLGKPKPLVYGKVLQVDPPLVNTSKLIYQVNDGAVASVDDVYDSGVSLGKTLTRADAVQVDATNNGRAWKVAYGAGLWVMATLTGRIYSSDDDGATWTLRDSTLLGGSGTISMLRWLNNALFIAAGIDGGMLTSPDGITWTSRTSTFGAGEQIRGLAYGNDVYLAVGASKAATSADGITWTQVTSPVIPWADAWRVEFGAGVFVVVGDDDTSFWWSADGTTYTAVTSGFGTTDAFWVTYGGGLFVAVGDSGTLATSPDGKQWTLRDTDTTNNFTWVGWGSQFGWIATVAAHTAMHFSLDGLTWSKYATDWPAAGAVDGGDFGNNTWVIADDDDTGSKPQVLVPSAVATYSSEADLLDDTLAPAPGAVKAYLTGGYFRLGSSPVGLVTADVTQGAAASDRTAGQVFAAVLTKAGKVAADYSAADVTALDSDTTAVVGYWSGVQPVQVSEVLDRVASSVGAWWGVDRTGVFRIQRLEDPQDGTSSHTFIASEMVKPLARLPVQDAGRGLPIYRATVRHTRYWTRQDSGLAGAVSDVRRADLAQEYREQTSTDATIQTDHLLAPVLNVDTLLTDSTSASTEAVRLLALRGVKVDRYEFQAALDSETILLDLGSVVTIKHDRFGLVAGGKFALISVEPNGRDRTVTFGAWGTPTTFARWPYAGTTTTFARADTGTYVDGRLPTSAAASGAATVTATVGTV